jgi:hypothetical protein
MRIGLTEILDEYAEAFNARYARLIVTDADQHWVMAAAREATGYATSVVGCDSKAGIERFLFLSGDFSLAPYHIDLDSARGAARMQPGNFTPTNERK